MLITDGSTVAPLVGAWIEIMEECITTQATQSLPSWERGLKSSGTVITVPDLPSLPSWERGLKLFRTPHKTADPCRSPRGSVD